MRFVFVFEIDLFSLICVLAVCVLAVDNLVGLEDDEFIMIGVCGYLCTIAGLSPVGAGLVDDTVIMMDFVLG